MASNKIFTTMHQIPVGDEACRRVAPFWDREVEQILNSAKKLNELLTTLIALVASKYTKTLHVFSVVISKVRLMETYSTVSNTKS